MFHFICKRLPHLRASLETSPCQRLFFCSLSSSSISTSNASNQHSFAVSYLINTCGFPPEKAISASKHLNFKTPHRADSVLAFFKSHGFTENQVALLVTRFPRILVFDPEKNLLPKLEFFTSVGFSATDFAKIITKGPDILSRSLENQILPSFSFFRNLVQSDDKTISAIKRYPRLFAVNLEANLVRNIQILREIGVPESNILLLLSQQPRDFTTNTDNFRRIVEEVKKMGFSPPMMKFMLAIHALKAMSKSTWEKKMELYKKWGWSEDEIFMAFGKHPWCMMLSEDKIMRVMEFLVNKMGWKASDLANRPLLICLSLEKRIIPRCLIYQYLVEKGMMEKKKDFRFTTWLLCTDSAFLDRIRNRYEKEAPELLKMYQEKLDLAK